MKNNSSGKRSSDKTKNSGWKPKHEDKQTSASTTETPTEELLTDTQEPQQQSSSIQLNMNHNIRDNMEEETLPPSDTLFDDMQELKFELLEKTITIQLFSFKH